MVSSHKKSSFRSLKKESWPDIPNVALRSIRFLIYTLIFKKFTQLSKPLRKFS